ncbi:flagellar filament capping protein FliD [Cytobacillus sp. FJAT-54145]|uniref:Flagellar hook-associated protein 2 n=1 Tax=Cytobacillus spartinae TaxID=3299023 RepID=A0ABW6KBT1_9BACI
MRIGGLASGMDIDQIVGDLMKAERMPLDKLKQKKQTLEWKRDDFRSMNTLLLDFRSELTQMKLTSKYRARQTASTDESRLTATATSAANPVSYSITSVSQLASTETRVNAGKIYKNGATFDPAKGLYSQQSSFEVPGTNVWRTGAITSKTINVTTAGRTFNLDTANLKADELTNMSLTVNGIGFNAVVDTELGSPARALKANEVLVKADGSLEFGKDIAQNSVIKVNYIANDRTDKLTLTKDTTSWQLSQGSINSISSIKLIKDGTETPYTVTTDPSGVMRILDGTTEIGVINQETGKVDFSAALPKPAEGEETEMSLEVTYDHHFTSLAVDTHTSKGEMHSSFLVSGSESLNSVISRVNSSSAGVNMFYDSFTGQMTMSRTETGDFNKTGQEMFTRGNFLNHVLRMGIAQGAETKVEGKNAIFEINGLQTERTSNNFEMTGVTFNLKKTFTEAEGAVGISVTNNGEEVFKNIKDFVAKYNELIDKMNKKISEDRYRTYLPLTDEQREAMSEDQQEKWEEKAKSGLLRRDPLLSSALTSMRMNFSSPVANDQVSGLFNQMAKLGITTSANYLEGGKLQIDEAKLKKAIEDDPTSVENFFKGDGTTESQKGVVHRLYDSVTKTMDQLKLKAGNSFSTLQQYTIGRELDNTNDRIDRFEDRLKQVEDRYWRQFTAMEKAIQRSNEQSMQLMNQFSGGM